jgi:hypothetical protein
MFTRRTGTVLGTALILSILMGLGSFARAEDAADTGDVTAPDALPVNVQGSWTGPIIDNVMGAGSISVDISQTNRRLNGGWSATFPTSPVFLGNFDGRASARAVNLRLDSSVFDRKGCRLVFHSITASGTEIQGNYHWVNCGKQFRGDRGGTIDITPAP